MSLARTESLLVTPAVRAAAAEQAKRSELQGHLISAFFKYLVSAAL